MPSLFNLVKDLNNITVDYQPGMLGTSLVNVAFETMQREFTHNPLLICLASALC